MKFLATSVLMSFVLAVFASPLNVTSEDHASHLDKRARSAKRGASYNVPSTVQPLGQTVSWAYNWNFRQGGNLPAGVEYVPMLWGTDPNHLNGFREEMDRMVAAGSVHYLLGFNEPDHPQQANLSPQQAVDGWLANIQPYAAKGIKLIAPAVTNGAAPMGLAWLDQFLSLCQGRCQIDGIAVHWYDQATNFAYFKNYMEGLKKYNKPVWITEWKGFGSADQQSSLIRTAIPYMGGAAHIAREAYFADIEGEMIQGGQLTSVGQTFNTA